MAWSSSFRNVSLLILGSHIEAIRTYQRPRTVREVQAFLGLCSYFRKFVRNFSLIARPLYILTKEGIDFLFDGEVHNEYKRSQGCNDQVL